MTMKSSTIQRTVKKVNYRRIKIYKNLMWERGCLNLDQMMLIFLLIKTEDQPLSTTTKRFKSDIFADGITDESS